MDVIMLAPDNNTGAGTADYYIYRNAASEKLYTNSEP